MSLTLGQKLRQAREEKGIPVSEVAEQTRIAPLYIDSIDNDVFLRAILRPINHVGCADA